MGIPDGSCGPFYRHRQVLRAAICLPSRVWILCGVRRQEYRGPLASDDFLGGAPLPTSVILHHYLTNPVYD